METTTRRKLTAERRLWRRLTAFVVVPLLAVTAVIAPAVLGTESARAAGTAQVLVSVTAVDATTGAPITTISIDRSPRRIAFRVDYSCVTSVCTNATVTLDPTQLDPNHDLYRLLTRSGFTPPLSGGTITGSDTAGWTVSLGNLAAGASGQFTIEYQWPAAGGSGGTSERINRTPQLFPDGWPITATARGNADTAVGERTSTSSPVTWRIQTPTPTVTTSVPVPGGGFFATDTNITFTVGAATGCDGQDRLCGADYTATVQLPPGAEFVSGVGNPTVSGSVATGLILTWDGPAWAATGATSQVGFVPGRTVTMRFPRANLAPAGRTCNYTTTFSGFAATFDVTYISMPGTSGVEKTATSAPRGPFQLRCTDPFPRASAQPKVSTFDGSTRESANVSQVIVPTGTGENLKEWQVTVSNTANIAGVAIVTDNTLDRTDLPVYRIVAAAGSTIEWTATDGITTQSGTSTGTANAPAGFRFVTSTVTSPRLAPPNQIVEQTFRTDFTVRYQYRVTPGATAGTAGHTNTASAVMTWPDNPEFANTPLSINSHTVNLIAPFARIATRKFADTYLTDPSGSERVWGQNIDVPIPVAGSSDRLIRWTLDVANTGNAPAIPTVVDTHLGDDPGLKFTTVAVAMRVGDLPLRDNYGDAAFGRPFSLTYTLDDGTVGTYSGTRFTAPPGRHLVAATVTGERLDGVSPSPSVNNFRTMEVYFDGLVSRDAVRGTTITNSFEGSLDYTISGLGTLTGTGSATVHLTGVAPTLTATMNPPTIAGGASRATTTSDVTFTVCGSTRDVAADRSPFSPEYVFMAPAGWNITAGSASFPAGTVPAGVVFTYRAVTVAGVERQVVVASWPAGTTWGRNATLPCMGVIARPSAAVPAGSVGVPRGFVGNSASVLAGDTFTREFTDTVNLDGDAATTRFSESVAPTGVPVASVGAMQVLKEICLPDASRADGCEWFSDPDNRVGVPPNSTSIRYRVTVTNTGNTTLSDLAAYDILPYPGDAGTSDPTGGTPRGSTIREVVSDVSDIVGSPTISYSASEQPCRSEVDATVTGCVDDWSSTMTDAQAIRITRAGSFGPGESISLQYTAAVLENPGDGAVGCNSIAVKATGLDTVSEPAPVCASIEETDLEITAGTPRLQIGRPGVLPWAVVNNGGAPSSQGTVRVTIPEGLSATSLEFTGWRCTAEDADGAPQFGTAVGPSTLSCTPTSPLLLGVPQVLDVPVVPQVDEFQSASRVSGRLFDGDLDNNDATMMAAVEAAGDMSVTKDDGVTDARPGDMLTYTITVHNPLLFETLSGATLTDPVPGGVEFVSASDGGTLDTTTNVVTWDMPDLPGDGTVTRTLVVRVLSTVASATLRNTATITASDPATPGEQLTASASDEDDVTTSPGLTIDKGSLALEYHAVGDVVTYTFSARNSGDVTLHDVTITDPLAGLSAVTYTWPGTTGVLAPGETVTARATYTVTQADMDSARVDNTATATGATPNGRSITDDDSHQVAVIGEPAITLDKSTDSVVTRAGDVVTYTFTVTNTGDLTLYGVGIADPMSGLSAVTLGDWPGAAGVLAPGEFVTATATYAARQADVDAGLILNTATAAGTPTGGAEVSDQDDATVTIDRVPGIAFDKDAAYEAGQRGEAGDELVYEFTATNTGNTTLTAVVIDDPLAGLSELEYAWPGTPGTLLPGQSVVATARYTVTQVDVDSGTGVTNTATVEGTPPVGDPVTGTDTVTMATPADAGIQIVKTAHLPSDAAPRAGDTVTFRFAITNLGVVTLSGVDLVDELAGLSDIAYTWPGAEGVLAPGDVLAAEATYVLTQADVDAAQIVNTASTGGVTPQGDEVADDDTVTLVLPVDPAVAFDKTASVHDGMWSNGDLVTYRFTIRNTGNVTLTGVTIADPMPGLSTITYTWPGNAGSLAPGERATATATYRLTAGDAAARTLTNTATTSSEQAPTAEDTVELTGPPPPSAVALAFTGADPLLGTGVALAAMLAGLVLMGVRMRRMRRERM